MFRRTNSLGETAHEGFASTCSVLAVGLFVLTFVFQNFMIPSSSMASTLLAGDHVVVERETLAPAPKWAPFMHYREVQRGDIVVFYKPTEEANGEHIFVVKRVVGIPGDRIHLRNGIVFLNGVAQDEPQAAKPTAENYDPYVDDFPSVSPSTEPRVTAEWSASLPVTCRARTWSYLPGTISLWAITAPTVWTAGLGFLTAAEHTGRPLFVYWSIVIPESGVDEVPLAEQAESTLHELIHFFDETRWSRTFHRIQ